MVEASPAHVRSRRSLDRLGMTEGGVGMTEGWLELGDERAHVRIETDRTQLAIIGLVTFRETTEDYFCRVSFSAGELDETRKSWKAVSNGIKLNLRLSMERTDP